jgi:2-methylcitrate dehydratase PrpD
MTTGLTKALAEFVAKPTFGGQEQAAYAVAKTGFIDTIATMMAGHREPVVDVVRQFFAQATTPAESPVPFLGTMHPAAQAAFINAVAGHALDYDDVAISGHPSTVLVPAILAEGYKLNSSGLDAVRAYIVGYEVWGELVSREPEQYHLKGWHPTGVFGTMTKPFHAGRAASHGIEAVRLSKLGMTSAPDVFEHPAGYLFALSLSGRADLKRPADTLGKTLRILDSGLSIKRYPVCYSSHRTIDGVLEIVERENLKAEDISKVHLTMGPAQASMLRNKHPVTGLEAKFSAQFAVASAVVARQVGLSQLTDAFATRPDVSELYGKVSITTVDTACPLEPAFAFTDRVVIETKSGKKFDSGEIRFPLGNAKNPIDAAGLKAKFMDCVATGKAENPAMHGADAGLYDRIAGLENLPSVQSLFGK